MDGTQLMIEAHANRSVIGNSPCFFDGGRRHKPARFIVCLQFAILQKLLSEGLYAYRPQGKQPRKTGYRWAKLCGICIMDPDGWCRNPEGKHDPLYMKKPKYLEDKLTFDEFRKRECRSTIMPIDPVKYERYRNAKTWRDVICATLRIPSGSSSSLQELRQGTTQANTASLDACRRIQMGTTSRKV